MNSLPPEILAKIKKDPNGMPYLEVSKDILRLGTFKAPSGKWKMEVTPDKLKHFAERGNAMIAAGLDVEATINHSPSARDVVGGVSEFWVSGDSLMAKEVIKGIENINMALVTKNVSVEIDPDFVDGAGKNWGEAITAVSFVQGPVVSRQKQFIAASLKGVDGCFNMRYASLMVNEPPPTVVEPVAELPAAEDHESVAKKHAELQAAHADLMSKHADLSGKHADLQNLHEAASKKATELERANEAMKEAHKELKKKMSLIESEAPEAAELFNERAEGIKEKFLSLIGSKVEITKALVDEMLPALTSGGGRKIMLSRTADGDAPAKQILAALFRTAKPAGAKTGIQMSRNADQGDGGDEASVYDKAVVAAAARAQKILGQ